MSQYFSKEGLEKLKKELDERINVIRPEIASLIKDAKEQGDLSENAEFDAAKEAQAFNEGRIEDIKKVLEGAVIFSDKNGSGIVAVGSSIKVESEEHSKQTFVIVGAAESDPIKGYISNESPLGKAFLGHQKGDIVEVKTPKGTVEYKISEIN